MRALPRPFEIFVNTIPGPYVPGASCAALELGVRVMLTPPTSAEPKLGFAVSHDGVLMEYLTDPVDALMRYSMRDGENGPPGGPETRTLADGLTISAGDCCSAEVCADETSVKNSIADIASKVIEVL
jgi:hypothetical protein